MESRAQYFTDAEYMPGYYRELAPGILDFALLLNGREPPKREGMAYLDLGFGQGVSVNMHAAAAPGDYWGTDFMPAQAAHAQSLAAASGAQAHFFADSFAAFATRTDLPDFDYIVLHGIWTWVPDENRAIAIDLVRRKLKPGGVLYMSYNILPGWASTAPLRQLVKFHYETLGDKSKNVNTRIDDAILYIDRLSQSGARYFLANPVAKPSLEAMAKQDRSYLAHELLNPEWSPMYCGDVFKRLAEAHVAFAGTAMPINTLDELHLKPEQRAILAQIEDPPFREITRDYMTNEHFRRDLFVRDARTLTPGEIAERILDMRVMLAAHLRDVPLHIGTTLGQVSLSNDVYAPILDHLAGGNYAPKRVRDLAQAPGLKKKDGRTLIDAMAVLIGSWIVFPVQSDAEIAAAAPQCRKLNGHIVAHSPNSAKVQALASPVIGMGFQLAQYELIFLHVRAGGSNAPGEWAGVAAKHIPGSNAGELATQARLFAERKLPVLKALQIVD